MRNPNPLTDKQRKTLGIIGKLTAKLGHPPSGGELGERLQISPAAASMRMLKLYEKGKLTRTGNGWRRYKVKGNQ